MLARPHTRALAHAASRRIQRTCRHASSIAGKRSPAPPPDNPDRELTGAARLFADAIEEESARGSSARDHLRLTQGEIWTGDENQVDAVLRMLVDAHKPLRSGEGLRHDTADKKIKGMMKGLKLEPREAMLRGVEAASRAEEGNSDLRNEGGRQEQTSEPENNPHRTTLPPHLHRPWHSTYTGSSTQDLTPKVRYGMFIQKNASGEDLDNILELRLPPGADGKMRSKVRDARKSHRVKARFETARESAIDYRISQPQTESGVWVDGEGEGGEAEEAFTGNRQARGASVLGTQKGGASGLRAWAGLVEDRIQRARESGFLKPTQGLGKPLVRDPEAGNPHIESGELLMNRIVKRQGALPPWIELQNNLDGALSAFRNTLRSTYTTHLVRIVISTETLSPLPPLHAIPDRDEVWEARELKFHEENVRQINDLVRRMNALAPPLVRRGLVQREMELERVRKGLKEAVWEEVQRRAREHADMQTNRSKVSPYYLESESLARLSSATRRSLWTIAHPVQAMRGGARGGSSGGDGGQAGEPDQPPAGTSASGKGVVVVAVGLGLVGYAYMRRPARNDSPSAPAPRAPAQLPVETPQRIGYGPVKLLQVYILEPILTFFRFIHLAVLFGPVILTMPMIFVGRPERRRRKGKPVADDEETWGATWWYGFLVRQMERAGPSFIKLGQWAASRADLFPAVLCDLMGKLHSNGDPHSIRHTRRSIENAFGLTMDEIFEDFEEKPIGCGAIAQVYKARLRPEIFEGSVPASSSSDIVPTTAVAIKVLHPRVRKTVRRDIAIMMVFARVLDALPGMHWLSLPEEVQVFGGMMNQQLDLRVEADNLDRFEENFRDRGSRVTFPRPIKLGRASNGERRKESREVLMEEYEDAVPLKHFLRNGGGAYDDMIANIGLDAFLEMLLLDNWTHGDLHPGNIMVRFYKPSKSDYLAPLLSRFTSSSTAPSETDVPTHSVSADNIVHSLTSVAGDPDKWHARLDELYAQGYAPQLIFIDAGLVTSLDDTNRRNFLDLFQAVAEFDGYKAGKLMVERCKTPEYALDEETFALKIQHLVLSVKSKTFSLAKIKISEVLTDVLTAVRQHHVKLEGDFVNTVISILLLEGIGRQLDPDMDLFKSALPILRQVGRQMGVRDAMAGVPKGNLWAMVKLWVWIEMRQLAGEVSGVDAWIKYDRLVPAM